MFQPSSLKTGNSANNSLAVTETWRSDLFPSLFSYLLQKTKINKEIKDVGFKN